MTIYTRVPLRAAVVTGVFLSLALTGPALAVDNLGLFELDGNAVNNSDQTQDDWADLYEGGGNADTFTGVNPDPAPLTTFTGGRKDIQPISSWGHKSGSSPDKAEITNAYSAAYDHDGDLIVYFGADRISNNGDTFLGFWFFKNHIVAEPDGSFSGEHEEGDALILANFPQASNAVPVIQVLKWDSSCSKASNNNPQPGDCAATNLRMVFGGSGASAVCDGSGALACAITNEEGGPNDPTDAPWPYTSKDGYVNEFPYETFFEGGANLTKLLGGTGADACFASFMAETRASSSPTASLMDFVLDSFPVCAISVTKSCTGGTLNAAQTDIIYGVTGTVTNDGFGTIHNVSVSDVPAFDAGSLQWTGGDPATLAGGASINYSATITVPLASNGTSNTVTATANTAAGGTGTVLSDTASSPCPVLQVNPAASVTKSCVSAIATDSNMVYAQVNVSGEVCNTGDSNLTNVTVTDNKAGVLLTGQTLVAPADPAHPGDTVGACQSYTGSYTPKEAEDAEGNATTDPSAVVFKDTVTVTATNIFGDALVPTPTAMAECPLCICEDCE